MGMIGLRDVFVVAPASSFHQNSYQHDLGVIPPQSNGIQLWQNHAYFKKQNIDENISLLGSQTAAAAAVTTCQDCGNQAKKDCSHRRCRTCCKSRGFDCSTHVKSTWVPAARRRERHLMTVTGDGAAGGSSVCTSGVKKPRLISSQTSSTSNTTPARSFDTSSSQRDLKEGLPGEVRAPAVFKCVRVTAVDDGEDEYAYQAVVKIGGHVFKGFLYDQGEVTRDVFPNISELHLGGGSGGGDDPADVYATSQGGMLGGSAYGNQIN